MGNLHMSNRGRAGRSVAVVAIIVIATAGILVGRDSNSQEGEMLSYLSFVLYVAAALLAVSVIRNSRKGGSSVGGEGRSRTGVPEGPLDVSDIEREFDALEKEIDREENGGDIQS